MQQSAFPQKIPPAYKKRLSGNLRAIQNLADTIGFEGELERPFEYDLDPPNEKMLVGVIDRLILKKGQAFIIDYKTTKKGRWRKNQKTIKSDLQLRAYSRVIQKELDLPAKSIKAALYYVEGGDLIGAKFSEESLLAAEKELLTTYQKIEQKDPNQVWGTIGHNCDRCEYSSICPFLKTPNLPPALR